LEAVADFGHPQIAAALVNEEGPDVAKMSES
jgi:hypothetical protein